MFYEFGPRIKKDYQFLDIVRKYRKPDNEINKLEVVHDAQVLITELLLGRIQLSGVLINILDRRGVVDVPERPHIVDVGHSLLPLPEIELFDYRPNLSIQERYKYVEQKRARVWETSWYYFSHHLREGSTNPLIAALDITGSLYDYYLTNKANLVFGSTVSAFNRSNDNIWQTITVLRHSIISL